jgi:hypothetical protein
MCTGVSEKLVQSLNQSAKYHYDAIPTWKMIYWKCYSVIQVLMFEEFQSSWGQPDNSLENVHNYDFYTFHTQNIQALQSNYDFVREIFCNWMLRKEEQCTRIVFADESIFSTDGITKKKCTCGPKIILMRLRKQVSKPLSR